MAGSCRRHTTQVRLQVNGLRGRYS